MVKFKITRPDGTTIEGEGAIDDVLRLSPPPIVLNPIQQPITVQPFPWTYPTFPGPIWIEVAPKWIPDRTATCSE